MFKGILSVLIFSVVVTSVSAQELSSSDRYSGSDNINGGHYSYTINIAAKSWAPGMGDVRYALAINSFFINSFEVNGVSASSLSGVDFPLELNNPQADVEFSLTYFSGTKSITFENLKMRYVESGAMDYGDLTTSQVEALKTKFDIKDSSGFENLNLLFRISSIHRDYIEELSDFRSRLNKQKKEADEKKKLEEEEAKKNEHVNTKAHNDEMKELDAQLKQKIGDDKKTSSIDDFLSTTTAPSESSSTDFLAEATTAGGGDDFIAGNTSNKEANKQYEIKYKDGKQGVVAKDGRILIPFKQWEIKEYLDGVAKVKILIDEVTLNEDFDNDIKIYGFNIYKTGFVDISGKFLEKPAIEVDGGYYNNCIDIASYSSLRVIPKGQSRAETKRIHDQYIKQQEVSQQKCNRREQELIAQIKSRYQ